MNERDLYWAGGLFDGEGCISISRTRADSYNGDVNVKYRLWISLAMCCESTVRRFATIIDDGNHVYRRVQKTWKNPHFDWRVVDVIANNKIRLLIPYLYTKRAQAETALAFRGLIDRQQFQRNKRVPLTEEMLEQRAWFYAELKKMKDASRPFVETYNS